MARPPKLNDRQKEEIKAKRLRGITLVELAKEYNVSFALISSTVSERVSEMDKVARSIANAKLPLKDFNVSERASITTFAEELIEISTNISKTARHTSSVAAKYAEIASLQFDRIDPLKTLEENTDSIRSVNAMVDGANKASHVSLNLIAANKETVKDMNSKQDDDIPVGLGFLYGE
jgi:transcriptional regulator with XRE-family HTH domain